MQERLLIAVRLQALKNIEYCYPLLRCRWIPIEALPLNGTITAADARRSERSDEL